LEKIENWMTQVTNLTRAHEARRSLLAASLDTNGLSLLLDCLSSLSPYAQATSTTTR
jgi:hypothetical protein